MQALVINSRKSGSGKPCCASIIGRIVDRLDGIQQQLIVPRPTASPSTSKKKVH